jgi:hypothetical protein
VRHTSESDSRIGGGGSPLAAIDPNTVLKVRPAYCVAQSGKKSCSAAPMHKADPFVNDAKVASLYIARPHNE